MRIDKQIIRCVIVDYCTYDLFLHALGEAAIRQSLNCSRERFSQTMFSELKEHQKGKHKIYSRCFVPRTSNCHFLDTGCANDDSPVFITRCLHFHLFKIAFLSDKLWWVLNSTIQHALQNSNDWIVTEYCGNGCWLLKTDLQEVIEIICQYSDI